jgi:hypothetical protein
VLDASLRPVDFIDGTDQELSKMSAMPIAAIVALSVLVLALGGEWHARRMASKHWS